MKVFAFSAHWNVNE